MSTKMPLFTTTPCSQVSAKPTPPARYSRQSYLLNPQGTGLLVLPSLVPPAVQRALLSRMIHRDLSDPRHQTNMHLHFELPYPPGSGGSGGDDVSFFSYAPDSPAGRFAPRDPATHKPLSVRQVLERRLHWVTLGGQYDWTKRVYPPAGGEEEDEEAVPPFPADTAALLEGLFPETRAQAAIVNFYSPGDTMMMHRDVSEETDRGLISISIGCDGLFMIAPNGGRGGSGSTAGPVEYETKTETDTEQSAKPAKKFLLLRLRSGDPIYMTRDSRFAWHGVPKVLKGTCPDYLADWPAEGGKYEEWRGWMRNKRINLNVRQMRE